MRIALFTDTYVPDVNGVAKTLGRLVRYLESRGVACKVFAPRGGHAADSAEAARVERFYSIPFLLYPECKLAIPNPLLLRRALQEFAPTLIHTATPFNLGLFGHHYAIKHRIPLVASYHTHFDQYLAHYKLQWMEPMLWRYMAWFHVSCKKVYVPSLSAMEHLRDRGIPNMEVWGRGVDTARFRPGGDRSGTLRRYGVDPEKKVLLYVGRLAPEKSLQVLTEAVRQLRPELREQVHVIMAGDGPLYEELKEQADPAVTLAGFVEGGELSSLYAAADLFVFPSATETFGNVVLEAMASGTTVVGADAGGVGNSVEHMRNGWLCPPGDAAAFAAAIDRLLSQDLLRAQLAAAGRAYSLQQSWDSIFDRLLESYREAEGTASPSLAALS